MGLRPARGGATRRMGSPNGQGKYDKENARVGSGVWKLAAEIRRGQGPEVAHCPECWQAGGYHSPGCAGQ